MDMLDMRQTRVDMGVLLETVHKIVGVMARMQKRPLEEIPLATSE